MENEISTLRKQVNGLLADMKQMQSQRSEVSASSTRDSSAVIDGTPRSASNQSTSQLPSKTKHPRFPGPTSSAFGFSVANSTLNSMGLQAGLQGNEALIDESTQPTRNNTPEPVVINFKKVSDPLQSISISEVLRLLRIYKEEVGLVYPFIHVDHFIEGAPLIYESLQTASSENGDLGTSSIDNKETRLLKMMVATALVVEGLGQSTLGQQLVESVEFAIGRSARDVDVDFTELQILTISVCPFICHSSVNLQDHHAHMNRVFSISTVTKKF
jgi:hypothetical protein